ncbi:MAG: hypothetical protein ACFE8P_10970 [Promethearchaeota archaeon]
MGIRKSTINKYFKVEIGDIPIVLSCPHGGHKKPENIQDIINGAKLSDRNTLKLAKKIISKLKEKGHKLYSILCKIHRSKLDLNRPPGSSVAFNQSSQEARELHYFFQRKLKELAKDCVSLHNKCFIIDFHGFTKPNEKYPEIIFGNIFSNTLSLCTIRTDESKQFWGLEELKKELSQHFTLDDGLGINDLNLAYSGGYITHLFYRKEKINALQIEVSENIRHEITEADKFITDFVNGLLKCLK